MAVGQKPSLLNIPRGHDRVCKIALKRDGFLDNCHESKNLKFGFKNVGILILFLSTFRFQTRFYKLQTRLDTFRHVSSFFRNFRHEFQILDTFRHVLRILEILNTFRHVFTYLKRGWWWARALMRGFRWGLGGRLFQTRTTETLENTCKNNKSF